MTLQCILVIISFFKLPEMYIAIKEIKQALKFSFLKELEIESQLYVMTS